jgi:Holliday junction DNA helicase RuvA
MIGWLSGTLNQCNDDRVIVQVGGVGYVVQLPLGMGASLVVGEPVTLYIHTHVREDALALFGFASEEELSAFETLIKVTGVGPKLAHAVLGSLSLQSLAEAIDGDDIGMLKRVPGVGKRVAERLALELKGKIRAAGGGAQATLGARAVRHAAGDVYKDLESALLNLQYRKKEVDVALSQVQSEMPDETDFDALLRAALSGLRR